MLCMLAGCLCVCVCVCIWPTFDVCEYLARNSRDILLVPQLRVYYVPLSCVLHLEHWPEEMWVEND